MELRWTLYQALLLATASLAQNLQQGGFPSSDSFSDARFQQPAQFSQPPQQQQQAQRTFAQQQQQRAGAQQQQAGGFAAPQRPRRPSLDVQGVRGAPRPASLQPGQVQTTQFSSQGFQNVPQQVRAQAAPAVQQPFRPPPPPPQPQQVQPQASQQFFDDQQQQQRFQQPQPQPQSAFEPEPAVRRPLPQLEPLAVSAPAPVRRPQIQQAQPLREGGSRPLTQDEELIREQNLNAKYAFSSAVTDGINDNEHVREEVRDGLNLKGLYSYSDGFFKRTVHYEADENGYRVTKEEVDPLGDGPRTDPNGRAQIASNVGGNSLEYTITAADIPFLTPQEQHSHQNQRQHQQPAQPQQFSQQQHQQQAHQQQPSGGFPQ